MVLTCLDVDTCEILLGHTQQVLTRGAVVLISVDVLHRKGLCSSTLTKVGCLQNRKFGHLRKFSGYEVLLMYSV